MTGRSSSSRARSPSATTTTNRASAIACSISAWARSRSPSRAPRRRRISAPSIASSRRTGRRFAEILAARRGLDWAADLIAPPNRLSRRSRMNASQLPWPWSCSSSRLRRPSADGRHRRLKPRPELMTAARTLQTVNNQIIQIQQTVNAGEPGQEPQSFSNLNALNTRSLQYRELMSQAQGIVFDITQHRTSVPAILPAAYSATFRHLYQDAQTRWMNSVQAFKPSVQTQSRADIANDQNACTGRHSSARARSASCKQPRRPTRSSPCSRSSRSGEQLAAHERAEDLELARNATAGSRPQTAATFSEPAPSTRRSPSGIPMNRSKTRQSWSRALRLDSVWP